MTTVRENQKTETVHIRVEGRVQGVFFRDCTRSEACRIGITGWVMNMADGAVEGVFQGSSGQLREIVDWLHQGSPMSKVTSVVSTSLANERKYTDFSIRYR